MLTARSDGSRERERPDDLLRRLYLAASLCAWLEVATIGSNRSEGERSEPEQTRGRASPAQTERGNERRRREVLRRADQGLAPRRPAARKGAPREPGGTTRNELPRQPPAGKGDRPASHHESTERREAGGESAPSIIAPPLFCRLSLCLAGGCDHWEQPKRGRAKRARVCRRQSAAAVLSFDSPLFSRLPLCLAGGCDHREQPKRGRAKRARVRRR